MKRTIDARTPSARNLRLRGAHIGMDGEVLGGQDSLTGNRVTTPPITRDAFRAGDSVSGGRTIRMEPDGMELRMEPTRASESGAGRIVSRTPSSPLPARRNPTPIMGDTLGGYDFSGAKASTAAMREAQSIRDAVRVRSAVDAEKARQRARGTAAVKATFPTGASVREDFADNTKSIVGKYGSGFSTPQLPKPAQAVAGSGVTGIMDGYRNAMKAGTGLQKQGPQMKLPDLDPLKKRRAIAVR